MSDSPIVVTGAAGFIGARLVEALNGRGTPLVSVDEPAFFSERAEHAGLDFGRIVAPGELIDWLAQARPPLSAVVHLGACTDTTELDVEYLTRVNLDYSKAIWEHCSEHSIPLVYASSAATYGDGSAGYDDDESRLAELRPLNPYGRSKLDFDLWAVVRAGADAGAAPPAWSGWKFFNVYGFGERHKGRMASVVLQAYDQILAQGVVRLFQSHNTDYPDGGQLRDFVYVGDVLQVLLHALDAPIRSGIYNLGSGRARTFEDLARATFAALGRPVRIEYFPTPEDIRERYQYFTEARMEKLRAAGYAQPFTSLEDGVVQYVERLNAARARVG